MDIDPERIARSPFVIGALGALIAQLKSLPGATWLDRGVNVAAGSATAGFLTPALVQWVRNAPSPDYVNAAAFVVGLLGMSLIAAILSWLRSDKPGEIISSWIKGPR
jgi:hypothetical protein